MSYSIYIGQAELRPADPEDGDEGRIDVIVESMSLDEAPEFPRDILTGKSNGRHPAYSGWANFIDEAGLKDMFRNQDTGLMRDHPGCFPLLPQHLIRVEAALEIWKTKARKDAIPGWDPKADPWKGDSADPRYDGTWARLEWLRFWIDWALKNCSRPSIYNH